jgi:hypothetical protein
MIESHPDYQGKFSYWVSHSVRYSILVKKQISQSSGTVLCEVRRENEENIRRSRIKQSIIPPDGSTRIDKIKTGFV